MSTDISKIKAEIKEWQRAYRRAHGRDPGKEELRNNPEMQAKYKIWQDSLKADKLESTRQSSGANHDAQTDDTSPQPAPKSIIPKKMPIQAVSTGPSTPFSARKKPARNLTESAGPSSEPRIPALNLSAAKPRAPAIVTPFDSVSSARHRPFPSMLASDSDDDDDDDDDNPFSGPGPASPTGSRSRRSSQLISPSKSMLYRQTSSTVSTPQSTVKSRPRNLEVSPVGHAGPMTPRSKARKRMRGEDVPATPGDKRRKLGLSKVDKGQSLLGDGLKRTTTDEDEEDEEILESPRKKSALGANGRVYTNMFDDGSSANDDVASLRSTPPPPPSESGDSHAPDWDDQHDSQPDEDEPSPSTSRGKPILPSAPMQWTQDAWDSPAPGADLSHLRRGIAASKGKPIEDRKMAKPKDGAKKAKDKPAPVLSNPFDLLPPMPGEEPRSSKPARRQDAAQSKPKGKGKLKPTVADDEAEAQSDDDGLEDLNEVEWRPHGPLRGEPTLSQTSTFSQTSAPRSQARAKTPEDHSEEQPDPTEGLPSDLKTLLSIQATSREDTKVDALARDVLAGRTFKGADVWGVGDVGSDLEGDGYERDDWDSEPEGWTGRVEM